ncbi:MAG: hypothetical protein A2725_04360 [Candidatus Magasanikbacteria bacterium RIFCSPHIGHO2_01_FULL_33_34]|uniref:NIF system FeS cluster assembly NifU N-terminal domain-containing protein n=1 Tax=Candidatus Magasanikbacteria bacterium RIFCSPHIGHO2_01_FULL_33_34 TaxID=1798671 RepID=A0A1F6LHQ2_9BACT|nr:MAG: hypothetical protein A2725_04360 [Candidatus Magasanikbacteria bacterium RIFCSPHIGHO2_01_FULL_33_34]OGH65197.1 MAG: hypothetical protein A3B83_04120 [Candidatus Magasanikbacteria bacterium RIFCSPHIGHO2_02_FULL_33_17]OGH75258.1 MAG: hypothetical protein A3A89_04045 [Candidatus Magasanikbacteria bacterium RIFCSPLOWO2_01_FULL_33_34]OGH82180.1 MAG: hypothetical protein A3F93_00440 [Candidatus Magasanikbacteria bacterium RIFCSPLOWO2_12_FULL_34_7]
MDELYKEFILELNRNPLHKKVLNNFDIEQKAVNKSCGDDIKIQIKLDQNGIILDVGYQGQGCAISQAGVSLLLDNIIKKKVSDIQAYDEEKMIDIFGTDIIYSRKKCLMLGLDAVIAGLNSMKK